ncbi:MULTISPECIES: hypothetical protein [unclassified Haloferax]|uniref:hypothetical protein n=1 Tax=unclassified Haloferax TaxID=2625095 RepID=UPI0028750880|nr:MULTISPECIES: hypothetical protein [unclassified Haloferax]MDS0242893.1 hypothetical protein [Haloferax sp. S2CR25]MDS0446014.1 hypothetical protein [Haloferax sp. S2CR25-2]
MEVVRNVRELTAVLEQFTETTGAVCELELTSDGESAADGVLASVTVAYDLASECAVDPNRLSVSSPAASVADGRLRLELDVALAPPPGGDADPEPASAERDSERDSEPTELVARADGSGTRNAAVDAAVGPGASPPTMESEVPTESGETPESDRGASASADDATEAGAETETDASTGPDASTDPDASTVAEPAVEADAKADTDAEPDSDAVPAHHDPVRLREAYEACETFKEMTAALGVDVTPQTVRNQMIQRGIHEPESYGPSTETASSSRASDAGDEARTPEPSVADEGGAAAPEPSAEPGGEDTADSAGTERETRAEADAEVGPASTAGPTGDAGTDAVDADETPAVTEDDSGASDLPPLPASVSSLDCSTADVCAAVAGAKTLYEVERRLGLDRAEVRDVLTALDLLDLVTGRMARRDASAATPADVRTRARAALDGGAE